MRLVRDTLDPENRKKLMEDYGRLTPLEKWFLQKPLGFDYLVLVKKMAPDEARRVHSEQMWKWLGARPEDR